MDSETTLKQEIAWANHLSVQVNFNLESKLFPYFILLKLLCISVATTLIWHIFVWKIVETPKTQIKNQILFCSISIRRQSQEVYQHTEISLSKTNFDADTLLFSIFNSWLSTFFCPRGKKRHRLNFSWVPHLATFIPFLVFIHL